MIVQNTNRRQKVSRIILTLPFLSAITLLIIGSFTLIDIYLDTGFKISFPTVILLALAHIVSILILSKLDKIEIDIPNSKFKIAPSILGFVIMTFLSSILLEMGLRKNLNYWLKDKAVEKMELRVIDKYISKGKTTAYYIVFDSNCGRLKNKVSQKKYAVFSKGEQFTASVNNGFFEGYFLTKPLRNISRQ